MKWWTVVRVAGPVSIGFCLVLLRPTWVSVAVLGLLICVAVWLDGQERRADDVEDMEAEFNNRVGNLADRLIEVDKALAETRDVAADARQAATNAHGLIKELSSRLDATAQQRKGPSL